MVPYYYVYPMWCYYGVPDYVVLLLLWSMWELHPMWCYYGVPGSVPHVWCYS